MDLDRYSTEIFWDEDDQGFIALARGLPGCSAFGSSKEEALRELHDAMQAWIESAKKAGNPIPQPAPRPEFSGKFMVRMSKSLHADLAASAADEGVSLNHYVVGLLSRRDEANVWKRYLDVEGYAKRHFTVAHHFIASAWNDTTPSFMKLTQQRMMTTGVSDAFIIIVNNQNNQTPARVLPFTPAMQSPENYNG